MWLSLRNLVRNRLLLRTLVVREVKARYRGSLLGFFWSFLNPLLLLLVYTFVFRFVFARGGDAMPQPYSLFLFCGILPWTWFSASLLESSNILLASGGLLKKIMFPAETLPLVCVFSNLTHFAFGLPIVFLFAIALKGEVSLHALELPVVMLVQLVFTAGLALLVSALSVHFRDVRDLLTHLLTVWFFTTPIIYPLTLPQGKLRMLLSLNPMTHVMTGYQNVLFYGRPANFLSLGIVAVVSAILFLGGYFFFDRLRDTFAEEV
jgi:ABC-type polysaccharide/polyol phosphate export permease